MRGSQNKEWELLITPRRPLADNFIYWALVRVNAYTCAKFELPSSIGFGDMRGSQNKKWELLIAPRRPLADKFLYRALVRINAYKCAKF